MVDIEARARNEVATTGVFSPINSWIGGYYAAIADAARVARDYDHNPFDGLSVARERIAAEIESLVTPALVPPT